MCYTLPHYVTTLRIKHNRHIHQTTKQHNQATIKISYLYYTRLKSINWLNSMGLRYIFDTPYNSYITFNVCISMSEMYYAWMKICFRRCSSHRLCVNILKVLRSTQAVNIFSIINHKNHPLTHTE